MEINLTGNSKINTKTETKSTQNNNSSTEKFSDELKKLEDVNKSKDTEKEDKEKPVDKTEKKENKETKGFVTEEQQEGSWVVVEAAEEVTEEETEEKTNVDDKNVDKSLSDINTILEEMKKNLDQSDENKTNQIKNRWDSTDNNRRGNELINNEYNIQENKDILPQMNPNMNFSGDGQPFSSFMNQDSNNSKNAGILGVSADEIAEEATILSTMAENIAIANQNSKNVTETDETQKIVTKESGLYKVNTTSGITIETVVKYDNIIMNQADVDVFANLVQGQDVNLNNLTPEAIEKSTQVSKTLADMLAKSMENNQPLRIDFDNNISVIIRISRDGKLSADFLPSSQIAEAYLKENLPLLKQRFDENNIDYDELNQRNRREREQENNKRKDRNNE